MNFSKTVAVLALGIATASCSGYKEVSYEDLDDPTFFFKYSLQEKEYDTPGWTTMTASRDGWVEKMKLVDCRGRDCIYLKRIADSAEDQKSVQAYKVNCTFEQVSMRKTDMGEDHGWFEPRNISWEGEKVAFAKYCL